MTMPTITLGRRLIPVGHIALIEPFTASPRMQSERAFQARVVLLDRQSLLTEDSVATLAAAHGFRTLEADGVAVSPGLRFWVEGAPGDGFTSAKAYHSRLLWRDLDGQTQSTLLLSSPEAALAVAVQGSAIGAPETSGEAVGKRAGVGRSQRRRKQPGPPAPQPV